MTTYTPPLPVLTPASSLSRPPRSRLALSCPAARAQTTDTIDATEGNVSISTAYTTTGGLTLDLGFFVD